MRKLLAFLLMAMLLISSCAQSESVFMTKEEKEEKNGMNLYFLMGPFFSFIEKTGEDFYLSVPDDGINRLKMNSYGSGESIILQETKNNITIRIYADRVFYIYSHYWGNTEYYDSLSFSPLFNKS